MAIARELEPTEPRRVKAFARFFKSYMSIWAIVVAALPIPVTLAGTIPTYAAQKGILATYTPLFCFLLLGFIFYERHSLARIMFGRELLLGTVEPSTADTGLARRIPRRLTKTGIAWLPALLILLSLSSGLGYMATMQNSIRAAQAQDLLAGWVSTGGPRTLRMTDDEIGVSASNLTIEIAREDTLSGWIVDSLVRRPGTVSRSVEIVGQVLAHAANVAGEQAPAQKLLQGLAPGEIPYAGRLMREYLLMFLYAEGAFILMAIREYLQDLVGLSELDLIRGARAVRQAAG